MVFMPVSVQAPPSRLCFRKFELDLASGELYEDGQKVPIPPKVFELLRAFAERPGEVVTRDELRAKLWSADTFVEFDDSLNHAVKKLRQALRDSAENPQYIETLPRFGYRFIAPVNVTGRTIASSNLKRRWRRATIAAVAILLVAGAVLVAFTVGGLRGHWLRPQIRSLAVIPFSNLTGDPQQDYFADGMTDALITDLAKIRSVKVISRTSVMRFKDTKRPLPEIARALGVDGIVEGSVQRSAGRVRITAQLIRATSDVHLWAESYERDTRDVLAIQAEIAQAVAREIHVALTPEESSDLARVRPVNPEAYEAYLKGQAHWYRIAPEHLDAALDYFQLALQKDPEYALAYIGVANVWLLRGDAGSMAPDQAYPQSKAAVARALQLDDTLADAHVTLANIVGPFDHDWAQADREFRRAIDLNPNSADAHFMYADFLISTKRIEEWDREIHRTLELDPFNPFFQCFYGWHLIYVGRYDEAIAQLRKVIATEPEFSSARLGLWGAYYKKGLEPQALGEARRFFAILHDREVEESLVRGEKEGGYTRAMYLAANTLATRAQRTHVPAVRVARLYAHAGDNEEVLKWLRKAFEQREPPLSHLGVAWDWDSLRQDQRFQSLLRDMGLPR